jgi:hypothetical protein
MEELIQIIKNSNGKIFGIKDLERKIGKPNYLTEEVLSELCRQLRDEYVICYVQGKGIFQHIRVVQR